jgi:hypothetical protein
MVVWVGFWLRVLFSFYEGDFEYLLKPCLQAIGTGQTFLASFMFCKPVRSGYFGGIVVDEVSGLGYS